MSYQGEHIIFSRNSRFILNLIRAAAAQMVVFGHGINFFNIAQFLKPPYMPYMQNISVVIFFLLSGFLISNSVYQKKDSKEYFFKDFCFDRSIRIYTTLLPMLFVIFLFDLFNIFYLNDLTFQNAFNFEVFISNVLMLQDSIPLPTNSSIFFLFGNTSFGSVRPLWTIPVEWWTYFLFGLLIFQTGKEVNFQKLDFKKKIKIFLIFILSYFFLLVITLGARNPIKILLLGTWIIGYFLMLLINIKNKSQYYSFQYPIALIMVLGSFYFFISTNINALIILTVVEIFGIILYYFYFYSETSFSKNMNLLGYKFKNFFRKLFEILTNRKEVSFLFCIFFIAETIYRGLSTNRAYEPVFIALLSISFYFLIIFFNKTTFKIPKFIEKIFQFLSSYSFVLYLLHYSLFVIFVNLTKTSNISPVLLFIIAFFAINIISILFALFTERKTNVYKKKLKMIMNKETSHSNNP